MHRTLTWFAMILGAAAAMAENRSAYPPPPAFTPMPDTGRYIQRTMRRMAESTPETNHAVRILYYGQSITRQAWTDEVTAMLKERFPHAVIEAKNLAIGGFAAQRLIKTVERDVGMFYPDLMIFHVYGSHADYENIMRTVRRLTTAEIAIANDHYGAKSNLQAPPSGWWGFMNARFLPAVAEVYHCNFMDIRSYWKQYLLDNDYPAEKLLRDGVHLNDHGNFLMARLINNHLAVRKDLPEPESAQWIRTYEAFKGLQRRGRSFKLEFTGNRVDAIARKSDLTGYAKVLIDGKPPSQHPECYAFTRPNGGDNVDWPWEVGGVPVRITSRTPLVEEDWIINIEQVEDERYKFEVEGSVTGYDGGGWSDEDFESKSGRIIIKADDWWMKTVDKYPSPVKPGYLIRFQSVLMGTDTYVPAHVTDARREFTTVLAQGLENTKHTLEIIEQGDDHLAIAGVRVYEPPLKPTPDDRRVADTMDPNDAEKQDALPEYIFTPE